MATIRVPVGLDGDGDERTRGAADGATGEATGANDVASAGSGDQVRRGEQDGGGGSDGGKAGRSDTRTTSEPDPEDERKRA